MSARVLRSGRVYCSHCNRHERMRNDGTFMAHQVQRHDAWGAPMLTMFCLGSYRTVEEVEATQHESTVGDWSEFIHHPNAVNLKREQPADRKRLRELREKERGIHAR